LQAPFLLGFGATEHASYRFYHLTAGVNTAYDKVLLRKTLVRAIPRVSTTKVVLFCLVRAIARVIRFAQFCEREYKSHLALAPCKLEVHRISNTFLTK